MIHPRHITVRLLLALSFLTVSQLVLADRCVADAEFVRAFPTNEYPSKFKFKFRVASDDCNRYGCTGWVHYRIHYEYKSGTSNAATTLVRYRIDDGQRFTEVTDETYPGLATSPIQVRDVEINEVSCSTP